MSDENNDLDRLLQGAFESRPRGGSSSPSMIDVRHRARRHQRRRVSGVVGVTGMLGVSGVAVLASRGTSETGIAGDAATTTWAMTEAGEMCGYTEIAPATTTTWSGELGCFPSDQFRCWGNLGTDDQGYTYFEICDEIAREQSPYPYPQTTPVSTVVELASTTIYPVPTTTTMPTPDPTTTVIATTTT